MNRSAIFSPSLGWACSHRVSAIALDALVELVGGQVIQELGEDGLSGIHPSLSAIRAIGAHSALARGFVAANSNRKNRVTS
jgi:hypothetical protein